MQYIIIVYLGSWMDAHALSKEVIGDALDLDALKIAT
jgi:hypothetical protein